MLKKQQFLILIVSIILTSCGPKTRTLTPLTITPLSESDRTNIKKVAIHITINKKLEAKMSTIKSRFWTSLINDSSGGCEYGSCLLFIPLLIVSMITEESIRSNMDRTRENEFNEDLAEIDLEKIMAERIDEYFENVDDSLEAEISEIQNLSVLAQQGFDTILDISVHDLKVLLCPKQIVYGYIEQRQGGEGPISSGDTDYSAAIERWNTIYTQYVVKGTTAANEFLYSSSTSLSGSQSELVKEAESLKPVIEKYAHNSARTWITYNRKLISTKDGRILWERESLYYDLKCENVEEMQDNPELVVNMLIRALGDMAVHIVNEIQ